LVFVASIAQVSIFSNVHVLGGRPDVLLLTLVSISLLRGPIWGAAAGFGAGLIVDTANLETLGVTSLLLTLAGYWIGRYGEASRPGATGRALPSSRWPSCRSSTRSARWRSTSSWASPHRRAWSCSTRSSPTSS